MPYAKAKMKTSDRPDVDRISDLPSNVISNILERLPLCEAVRTSALSKQWRMHWVSMSELVFDHKFFGDAYKWRPQDMSSIEMLIGKILLHHHGTVRKFSLHIPEWFGYSLDINPWISYVSRNSVEELSIHGSLSQPKLKVPLYLSCCVELVRLELSNCIFFLPSTFEGFKNLVWFKAASVRFLQDSLGILIANCPLLVSLRLSRCDGVNFIGGQKLKLLQVEGVFEYISVRDSKNLAYVYIDTGTLNSTAGSQQDMKCNVIEGLTTLCKTEILRFRGDIYKFLAATGLDKPFQMTFSNMKILSLHGVDFSEQLQFSFALNFIQSCPYIQELSIQAATTLGTNTAGPNFDTLWNSSCKMGNLQKVRFFNIVGLHSELKLIQNLLASAPKLKNFYVSAKKRFSDHQKSRVLMKLMKFSRASPEAQLKYVDPPPCL